MLGSQPRKRPTTITWAELDTGSNSVSPWTTAKMSILMKCILIKNVDIKIAQTARSGKVFFKIKMRKFTTTRSGPFLKGHRMVGFHGRRR